MARQIGSHDRRVYILVELPEHGASEGEPVQRQNEAERFVNPAHVSNGSLTLWILTSLIPGWANGRGPFYGSQWV